MAGLIAAGAISAAAAPPDYGAIRQERRLQAVRVSTPIIVDGSLDELPWRDAPVATGFLQLEPHEGAPATEATAVRVLYDDETLYIGVEARDSEPQEIIVSDLKKDFDRFASDAFEIVLDTFHDERNGYMFATNPQGAKWDAQMVNEGRDINSNWDGIWFVQTRITPTGWSAELAIPFRTLRFADRDVQTWGVNFLRRIRRLNEDSLWTPLPRAYQIQRVSMAGTLDGLRGLTPGSDLRLKPYGLTDLSAVGGGSSEADGQAGFDVKYGITSGLTWDFTVNTDFSQVEADEQQINLTRFNLFYPEKRDFFLENAGVFQFGPGSFVPGGGGGGGGGGGFGRANVLGDNILFFSRRIGIADDGTVIPILGGTRLTGRAGAFSIGALNIQQRAANAAPATNVTAFRLRRDVLGNSDVGVLVLNKEQSGPGFNRLAGADANFRFFRNLNLNAYVAKTMSSELAAAPGGEVAARGGFAYRGEVLETRAAYTLTGSHFNDELGFIPRTGIGRSDAFFGLHLRSSRYPPWLREFFPHYNFVNLTRTEDGAFDSRYVDYHLPITLQNGTFIETGVNVTTEVLANPFLINSRLGITIAPGRYEFNEYFIVWNADPSAPVTLSGRYGLGGFYGGYKHTYQLGPAVRIGSRLNTSMTWTRNVISLGGGYTTDLVSTRINYSFSTRMFVNALIQYNTDANQWTSNIRFNVIHRPLSDIFLVYNDRRDSTTGALVDRAFIAKMTYMLAF